MNTITTKGGLPLKSIGLWVLRALIAALFLFAGFAKLSGQPMMVEEFGVIGLGQWFRYLTGILEIVGAIGLVIPAVSGLAAILVLCIDVGAFIAQVAVLHQDWIHTIIIGALIGVLIYLQRERILNWF